MLGTRWKEHWLNFLKQQHEKRTISHAPGALSVVTRVVDRTGVRGPELRCVRQHGQGSLYSDSPRPPTSHSLVHPHP